MSTRSIYNKACPACSALVSTDTQRCDCGFGFDTDAHDNEPVVDAQTVQEEELLKEYIGARVNQAVVQMQTLQAGLVSDPKNLDMANKLMQAFSEVRELRAEMDTQTRKITQMKRMVPSDFTADATMIPEPAKTPLGSARPTQEFRAAQAAKTEEIMRAAGIDTKECPKCHAVIPQRAALCFCGNAFATGSAKTTDEKRAPASSAERHEGL